ncbi:MAG: hypoxanthine-guanine phosphoribosyltransferase [Gammaproteobacteria bacterium]
MADWPPGAEELFSAAVVDAAIDDMTRAVQAEIDTQDCVLLAVMLGGMIPAARIAGRLTGDFLLDYCHVTRYQGQQHGGEPQWLQRPRAELSGRTVLVVDDIFDEGLTLQFVEQACLEQGAARVVTAVLTCKRHPRATVGRRPDIVGLEVPDRYVFGCGMDLAHRWRHLPAIYALPEES